MRRGERGIRDQEGEDEVARSRESVIPIGSASKANHDESGSMWSRLDT